MKRVSPSKMRDRRLTPAPKADDDAELPDDFIPPNKRPAKRVTWGYVRRLYLDPKFGDQE